MTSDPRHAYFLAAGWSRLAQARGDITMHSKWKPIWDFRGSFSTNQAIEIQKAIDVIEGDAYGRGYEDGARSQFGSPGIGG